MSSTADTGEGSSSSSSSPFTAQPGSNPFGKPPVTISHPPTYTPPPKRVTPPVIAPSSSSSASTPAPLPADLNDAWRSLMSAIGQTVPYHLNRAVRAAQLLRTGGRSNG